MDEKEAEARPLMGTIFLVYSRVAGMLLWVTTRCIAMIPDPFPSSAFGKGSSTPDYIARGMFSHMPVIATPSSTVNNTNTWIITTETILDLAACS